MHPSPSLLSEERSSFFYRSLFSVALFFAALFPRISSGAPASSEPGERLLVLPLISNSGISDAQKRGLEERLRVSLKRHISLLDEEEVRAALQRASCEGVACFQAEKAQQIFKQSKSRFLLAADVQGEDEVYTIRISLYDSAHQVRVDTAPALCELCPMVEVGEKLQESALASKILAAFVRAAPNSTPTPLPTPQRNSETLQLITQPAGASCYLKDRRLGLTPIKLALKTGEYQLRFEKEGYISQNLALSVRPPLSAQVRRYELTLQKQAPAQPPLPPVAATPPPTAEKPREIDSPGLVSPALSGTLIGAGVIAVGVGSWLLSLHGEIACPEGTSRRACPDVYNTVLPGSLGLGVGAASLGAGLALLSARALWSESFIQPSLSASESSAALQLGGRF